MTSFLEKMRTLQPCSAFSPSEFLFVTEATEWGELGYKTAAKSFTSIQPVFWSAGMQKPDLSRWHGDWIICYKADLILSRTILEQAKIGAINLHPSPPEYRGLGGYWWALHNGDTSYGVTLHHMDERIDHGAIIKTNRFPIEDNDTVHSLTEKAAAYSLRLLKETIRHIKTGKPLTPNGTQWGEHLYTSKELYAAQSKQTQHALNKIQALHKDLGGHTPHCDAHARLHG